MKNIFEESFGYKLIYIFSIDDNNHNGYLKIGDATIKTELSIDKLAPNCRALNQAAISRINQYTTTAGIKYNLLHTELAVYSIKNTQNAIQVKAFRDHSVHKVLENSGFKKLKIKGTNGREWFKINLDIAIKAINAVKKNRLNILQSDLKESFTPIILRPEQEDAVKRTLKQFKTRNRMLWNAKMRFGKTLCALRVVKDSEFNKTIVVTHRPVVNESWYTDFKKTFYDRGDFEYGSKTNGSSIDLLLKSNNHIIYFASIQDLRGSAAVGGLYEKNDDIFLTEWDCVIVDEAHEGTTTALGEDVIKKIVNEGKTKFLALSGTPFNILNEFDTNIYTWDYVMEQESKYNYEKNTFGDSNPYDELPEMKIYTYDLGKIAFSKKYIELVDKAFNFREFFKVWTGDIYQDHIKMPPDCKIGEFVHENDIKSFLDLITKSDENSDYPYSTENYRNLFKHSLWMIPGVKEAKALSTIMKAHSVFGSDTFKIINVAGDGDEEEKPEDADEEEKPEDALSSVKKFIEKAGEFRYTITLSCGRLTTGVTVPEWTAVMMLSGSYSTSATNYLQTIFRVQSPCNKNGRIKRCCYVFDFAPDRTLKMVAEAATLSTKAGKSTESNKQIMQKFLNYCPIISVSGTEMKEYDVNRMLRQLKNVYAERVVRNGFDDNNLYNDELLKLDGIELKEFSNLKNKIGSSPSSHRTNEIDINNQGFTNEEYEENEKLQKKKRSRQPLTPEEEAKLKENNKQKKQRLNAISILRAISIRIPLLIYGADIKIEDDFTLTKMLDDYIIDETSWVEFMPKGVTKEVFKKFIKYYDEDIFIVAGRNIRNKIINADEFPPTERIKKISEIFAGFKDPDKETVLTPWRVVNMHLSESLGGYDFYNESHTEIIDNPRFVDKGDITKNTLANISARILEINSKSGLYPLFVAYSIFEAKCNKYSKEVLSLEFQNKLWIETVNESIYVICKTPMAKQITKRTLVGYKDVSINAHYFDDLINMLTNKPDRFIQKILKPSYWKKEGTENMKFDAIVGNPPYQESTENTSDKPIYPLFFDAAFELSEKVSFISPARFLFNAGKTSKEWNYKVLNDEHFKVIWYKSSSTDVFPNVDIKGGVAVTFRDTTQYFGKIGIYSIYAEQNTILNKVKLENFEPLSKDIYVQNKFDLNQLYLDYPEFKKVIGSKGKEKRLTTSIFKQLNIFSQNNISDSSIKILGLIDNNRVYRYIDEKYILKHENLMKYKVFVSKANGTGSFGEILSTPVIGTPLIGHTQTFISMGAFDTEYEANALFKYIKGKFARCMLGTLKVTQDNNRVIWANVPLQDFTKKSDINWSKSISDIDAQLYSKYRLSQEEIKFIESKILPMQ